MEKQLFSEFLKEILELGYDWYAWLHYPAPTDGTNDPELLKLWKDPIWTPEGQAAIELLSQKKAKCIRNWIGEVMLHSGVQGFHYIKVTEDREDYSSRYHVLFGEVSTEIFPYQHWLDRWREKSGGYGYRRPLDDRIPGLLASLVMKQGHRIEVYRKDPKEYYNREDFR
jgi:hypothetical protein